MSGERVARYAQAKAEWAAVCAARMAGSPAPATPTLDGLRPHQRRADAKFWRGVREQRSKKEAR